jgi:hypothetical protein
MTSSTDLADRFVRLLEGQDVQDFQFWHGQKAPAV